jgi:hypothetical protein
MQHLQSSPSTQRIPLWIKVAYLAFLAVMVPIYWREYGPTNFLYFCDIALFLALAALWWENALLASVAAVGIVLPQLIWVLEFAAHFAGLNMIGMSDYMFDPKIPLFTRGISLFHGWLPFLLLYVVWRLGYDRRGLAVWVCLAWALILISYFWMPPPGAVLANPKQSVNINYVFGFSDDAPQPWMPAWVWLLTIMLGLPLLVWWPTHQALRRLFASRAESDCSKTRV